MPLIIEIRPEAEAELARQAQTYGLATSTYAAALLEEAASRILTRTAGKPGDRAEFEPTLVSASPEIGAPGHSTPHAESQLRLAADRIRKRRQRLTLGGLRIKDLVNEGRR